MTKTLKEKLGTFYNASLAFIGASVLDNLSTSLCLHNGASIDQERSPIARYMMHQLGKDLGLTTSDAIMIPTAIALSYYLNKIGPKIDDKINNYLESNDPEYAIRNAGTIVLSLVALQRAFAAGNNFALFQNLIN